MAREQKVLRGHHATLVGVTWANAASDAEAFDRQYGLRYPVLRDLSGSFVRACGTGGVPETFVLSRQGRILAVSRGPVSSGWLRRTLAPIFAGRIPARV